MSKSTGNSSFRLWSGILFLFVCTAASLYAQGKPLTEKLVSLNVKNETLKSIFEKITQQTSLYFTGSADQLDRNFRTSITVTNEPLNSVLDKLLKGKGVSWLIGEKTITIVRGGSANLSTSYFSTNIDTVPSTITISGKVTDEKGNPIPGATVLVKNGKRGTTTSSDGSFMISGINPNSFLNISNIGYLTKEIPIKGRISIAEIKLKEYVGDLDETVVIAYGTTTKRMGTGNITSIKAEEIARQPVNNPLLTLAASVPGLQIVQNTGLSGSGVKVVIQGINSLAFGNDPFYVIDGVPYISQLLPNLGNMLGTTGAPNSTSGNGINNGNPLAFLNPNDIESIEVLKDADATSIYGSRAANGAILITTKKGKAGKTKIDLNVQSGFSEIGRQLDLLNTHQYIEMRKEALRNDGITTPSKSDYDINGLWDTTSYTNWQKELIGGKAKYQNVQLSIIGGTDFTQFLIGGGFHKETTVFSGPFDDQKGSVHFNINHTTENQKIKVQLSGNYMFDNNKLPQIDLTGIAMQTSPDAPKLYTSNETLNWMPNSTGTSSWTNPLARLYNHYSNKTNNLISNLLVSYQIIKGFEIKSSFGYTNLQTSEIITNPLISIKPESRPYSSRASNYGNSSINSWIIEPQITYQKKISKNNIEVLLGTTFQQNNNSRQQLLGIGYNSDLVLNDIKSASDLSVEYTLASTYKYNALFGRIRYEFDRKYIVSLTARRDGSSRFGSKNTFHNFNSIAGAWIFSDEEFVRRNVPFLSFGKLRISYGTTGSDQIGDYQFMNLYNVTLSDGVTYQGATGLEAQGIPNPYIQWEETKKIQVGLDLGFLRDKLLFNANFFRNRSSNQLLQYTLPYTTGFNGIALNFPAVIENKGFEISLTSKNIKSSNFNWTTNFNITIPQNKLIRFKNLEKSSSYNNLIINEPVTISRYFHFAGVDPNTGKYQFFDKENNSTTTPNSSTDKNVLIDLAPKYYGGLNNSLSYRGIQLDILLQFVKQLGSTVFFGNIIPGKFNVNQPLSIINRWQKNNDAKSIQKYSTKNDLLTPYFNAKQSDRSYSDASYIRLKNIALSWQLPNKWKQRLSMDNCRVYIQCQNLLTVTNYLGLDPETRNSNVLPPLRTITFGIQVTL
ncbi:TonB-linked outer membrane protein, SusC/RagA family [Chitinophaga sp. YR573]|uniref:SusC/RagA family TonB-linked outer membrane protein n=1 Tax=Chitinophaga sp. YR573 TaxID=1881040 RepID=UPI0008D2E1C4|nr:SusC/RagA family TonB-linked outer membrane protein [Chitinophaga sp. YR573]SEW37111.1 TonB-linked outer membrane protein, SusC/RagA family [Chitinophaga sp. YR573]